MVRMKDIRAVARRIGEQFHPDKVILFGSYAYGRPTKDSDVDLLVVMPFRGNPIYKWTEVRLKVMPDFATDLLVYTPAYVSKRIAMGDPFFRDIMIKGKVLYEGDHAGVDSPGRRRLQRHVAAASATKVARLSKRVLPRPTMRREVS